ncbi:MAG: peptidoglycan-binding domain-containing protein, partial [Candidatus Micrarchaeia archaeon]
MAQRQINEEQLITLAVQYAVKKAGETEKVTREIMKDAIKNAYGAAYRMTPSLDELNRLTDIAMEKLVMKEEKVKLDVVPSKVAKKEEEVPVRKLKPLKPISGTKIVEGASKMLTEEKEDLDELYNKLLSLDYKSPGRYKGKGYIGGARGEHYNVEIAYVQEIYNRLVEYGYIKGKKIRVDGIYGKETEEAIKKLQKLVDVKEDGYFGIDTRNALKEWVKENLGDLRKKAGMKEEE